MGCASSYMDSAKKSMPEAVQLPKIPHSTIRINIFHDKAIHQSSSYGQHSDVLDSDGHRIFQWWKLTGT